MKKQIQGRGQKEAVKEVSNIDYNGKNGSIPLADNDRFSQEGRSEMYGVCKSGEQDSQRTRKAVSGGGTVSDSGRKGTAERAPEQPEVKNFGK